MNEEKPQKTEYHFYVNDIYTHNEGFYKLADAIKKCRSSIESGGVFKLVMTNGYTPIYEYSGDGREVRFSEARPRGVTEQWN